MEKRNGYKAVDFMKSLFSRCRADGYVNMKIISEKRQFFIQVNKIGSVIPKIKNENKGKDLFYGIATRQKGNGKKGGIVEIPEIFIDFDSGKLPWRKAWKQMNFQLEPTAVVRTSFRRFHLHWFLKKPLPKDEISAAEQVLKRLASHLGGDLVTAEAAHLLRMPGKDEGVSPGIKEFS